MISEISKSLNIQKMFRTKIQTKQRRRQISRREETGLHVSRALPSQTINQEGGCIQHATTLSIGHPHTRSQRVIPAKEESKMKPRPQGGVRLFQIYTELQFQDDNREAGMESHQSKVELKGVGSVKNSFQEDMNFLYKQDDSEAEQPCDKVKVLMIWFILTFSAPCYLYYRRPWHRDISSVDLL